MWITDFIADNGLRPASWADLTGCRTSSITYRPATNTSEAKAGDLAVVVIRRNNDQGTPAVTIPAGWSRFLTHRAGQHRGNGRALVDVVYKVLTAGDLTTTFTFSHWAGVSATNDVCGAAFVFPDYHPYIPLDGLQWDYMNPLVGDPYTMRWMGVLGNMLAPEDHYVFNIQGWGGPSSELDAPPSGNISVMNPPDALYSSYKSLLTYHTNIILRKATAGVSNLVSGESWTQVMTDWTPYQLGTFLRGATSVNYGEGYLARLQPNTTLDRHYAYKTVTLEAGKWYTFNSQVYAFGAGYSPYNAIAMSIVPPSGASNEFGFAGTGYGQEVIVNDVSFSAYTDPQAGRLVWWWASATHSEGDGLPNYNMGRFALVFQAQESGTFQLRINVTNNNLYETVWSSATMIHNNSGQRVDIVHVGLIEGINPTTWFPSVKTPIYSKYQPVPAAYAKTSGFGTCGHLAFWVNPNKPLPPAEMHQVSQFSMGNTGDTTYGLISGTIYPSGNDLEGSAYSSTRLVYPSYGGSGRKYYAEMRVNSTWGNSAATHGIWVTPLYGQNADYEQGYGGDIYGWQFNGNAWNFPSGITRLTALNASVGSPANSKFGVVVDYPNSNVRFYKDGLIYAVIDMMGTAGADNATLPFRVFMAGGPTYGAGRIYWTTRLGSGFEARPIGTVPWDISNGGVPVDAAMTPEGVIVTKAVDQTRTDSTPTFADSADDELFYNLGASKKYYFEFMVRVEGTTGISTWDAIVNYTGGGSKQMMASISCDVADNPAGFFDGHLWADNSEAELTQTTTRQVRVFFYYAAPRTRGLVMLSGYIETGVAGGQLRLLWKPSATNASGCKVLAGSTLRIEECT